MPEPPVIGSPEWYAVRLLRRLEARASRIRVWDDYYQGVQPLAFASAKFEQAFGDRFPAFTSNFCSLVVDGLAERLEVQGFRWGGAAADTEAWRLWQANDLDASSQQAHTEALVKGTTYALVEPAGDEPVITIEDAYDAIVEPDPKYPRKRRAGLKRWVDDDGALIVVVYLPDAVYKYRSTARWDQTYTGWNWGVPTLEPGEWTEGMLTIWSHAGFVPYQAPDDVVWPLSNPAGVVPLVPLLNRPRLRHGGQSEIQPVRSNQDAINKYRTDALITSEFAAYPQRYLLNFEPEVDEATGRPREPFRTAIDRLWTVPPPDPDNPDAPEPKIGQLPAASLEPYARMIGMEVGHMSSISRLPYHYLLGTPESVPPSGESLKASEAGLEHKTERAQLFLGEGWEEVLRVAFLAMGDRERGSVRGAETIWADTETRAEAVRTDSVVKLHSAGIIDDVLAWEMIGLSPEQVARKVARDEAAEREAEAEAAAAEPTPPPPGEGQPIEVIPAPQGPRMGSGNGVR